MRFDYACLLFFFQEQGDDYIRKLLQYQQPIKSDLRMGLCDCIDFSGKFMVFVVFASRPIAFNTRQD